MTHVAHHCSFEHPLEATSEPSSCDISNREMTLALWVLLQPQVKCHAASLCKVGKGQNETRIKHHIECGTICAPHLHIFRLPISFLWPPCLFCICRYISLEVYLGIWEELVNWSVSQDTYWNILLAWCWSRIRSESLSLPRFGADGAEPKNKSEAHRRFGTQKLLMMQHPKNVVNIESLISFVFSFDGVMTNCMWKKICVIDQLVLLRGLSLRSMPFALHKEVATTTLRPAKIIGNTWPCWSSKTWLRLNSTVKI